MIRPYNLVSTFHLFIAASLHAYFYHLNIFVFTTGLTFMQRRNNEVQGPSTQVLDAVDVFNECANNKMRCNETPQRAIVSPVFQCDVFSSIACLSKALSKLRMIKMAHFL